MRVSLSNLPRAPREYVIDFPRLDGGLNNWELDYRIDANESPEMENLIWRDGALCCRDGQARVTASTPGAGWSAYDRLFFGYGFFHIKDALYCVYLDDGPPEKDETLTYDKVLGGVPQNRGSWFVYDGALYYKNRGGYFRIEYTGDGFSAGEVPVYTPIIQINTDPTTGAGDTYQPENRLCAQKIVWYSTAEGVTKYQLPVKDVDSVDEVIVDEQVLTSGYTVDLKEGTVEFATEPTHHNPIRVNTVKITYTKANPDAYDSIMDCPYATAFGGKQELCIVVGGCPAQPNAYFWNGNNVAMDPGYFPMEQYNFAGATEEPITGFGLQQSLLVVFKERSIGRVELGTTDMASGRTLLTMDYANINTAIGCDLPGTIQLVENNLVFANRTKGVHMVLDSSAAYENNIVAISRKVDNAMLPVLRSADSASSFDDGERYWVIADDKAYVWDYALSTHKNPSWFYFTAIKGIAFLTATDAQYHLGHDGHLSEMRRNFMDYGEPIHKVYQFATQTMGGYDKLKDVEGVMLVTRGDTDNIIRVFYRTDYEYREELTPVKNFNYHFLPRNLARRCLTVHHFAAPARRRPGCRHVRHFAVRLENNELATDMSVISAQIYYKYSGRER